MAATAVTKKSRFTKKVVQPTYRPTLETSRNYPVKEGALCVGVSVATIWRAIQAGRLKTYRVGSRVIISGEQLKNWLESGGKTYQK